MYGITLDQGGGGGIIGTKKLPVWKVATEYFHYKEQEKTCPYTNACYKIKIFTLCPMWGGGNQNSHRHTDIVNYSIFLPRKCVVSIISFIIMW